MLINAFPFSLRYTILGSKLKVCQEIKKKQEIKFVTEDFVVNFD